MKQRHEPHVAALRVAGCEGSKAETVEQIARQLRQRVAELPHVIAAEDTAEAHEALRGLVEAIRLVPEADALRIEVRGELGGDPAVGRGRPERQTPRQCCRGVP
jgi:hypothetical protein